MASRTNKRDSSTSPFRRSYQIPNAVTASARATSTHTIRATMRSDTEAPSEVDFRLPNGPVPGPVARVAPGAIRGLVTPTK